MIGNKHVDEWFRLTDEGLVTLNTDRIKLNEYLKRVVLIRDDVYFDEKQIESAIAFIEKWYFELTHWQKFLISFMFLFYDDGSLVFDEYFYTMSRGSGKNGLISGIGNYFLTPLHNVNLYHGAIVANSEKQAKTSFEEIYNMVTMNEALKYSKTHNPAGWFDITRSRITCAETMANLEYLTSNANTKDSFRHGFLIFDEIHEYYNSDIIDTLTSGLGKVKPERAFFISTNGYVRDGVYDQMLNDAREVLESDNIDSKMFPWICTLDNKDEVHDINKWQKANPMFHQPMTDYAKGLIGTVGDQWRKIQRGTGNKVEFMTKRMNIEDVNPENNVASKEEVYATNRTIPDITGKQCVAGLDFASLRDFAAIGLLFNIDGEYVWVSHSFILKGFLDNTAMAITPMIPQWEEKGLLTVVDEPSITIEYIIGWLNDMKKKHNLDILKVVGDSYRMDYVRSGLEDYGYKTENIRRSKAIEASVAPQIEVLFANEEIIYGDNPLMRWYTNNVYVARDEFGNMVYRKKEEKRRKTDGFMAFTHAFWQALEMLETEPDDFLFEDYVF